MRILLLTQIVPYPPDSGPKIKTYNVLRYLAQRHEVHLVSFVRPGGESQRADALSPYLASFTPVLLRRSRARDVVYFVRSLKTGRPFLIERDDIGSMRGAIGSVSKRFAFDAVHADQLSMGQFAVDLPLGKRVLDEHNAVWTIVRRAARGERALRRIAAELEWRKLKTYEGSLCRNFDRVTVVSRDDQLALEQAAGSRLAVTEIPIAIDTRELPFEARSKESRHVLSVATMFYPPNVEGVYWFATQVFPMIRTEVPGTRFYIVGSRPPAHVQDLARPDSGIEVTGYVDKLEPYMRRSAAVIVPVHSGSGMRVKILEAFARGIPVVSTTVGVEGIDAHAGEHLLVGDTPTALAAAVVRVLREPETASRLAQAGRALVEQHYDWRTALRPLDDVYP